MKKSRFKGAPSSLISTSIGGEGGSRPQVPMPNCIWKRLGGEFDLFAFYIQSQLG